MSLVTVPEKLWPYPELASALIQFTGNAVAAAEDGYTWTEARGLALEAAGTFVVVVRQYSSLTGEQKAALVDLALRALIEHLEPVIVNTVSAFVLSTFPWYVRWLPWLLSFLIKADVIGELIKEIPAIRQSIYDGLKLIWSQSKA